MTNTERGSILRTFFALLTLHTWFCAFYEPLSLHFMVTEKAGHLGAIAATLFGWLGFLALIDVVFNDYFPEYKLPTILAERPNILMAIALMNAMELFVALHYTSSWGLALYCLLVSSFVVITAFLDVHVRCAKYNRRVTPRYA